MRILIVVPEQDRISGNWITARRFQDGLKNLLHDVLLVSTQSDGSTPFRDQVEKFSPDVALLLHAYRSGKLWNEQARDLGIPYLVMLTGTDVNIDLKQHAQRSTIKEVLSQAANVLLQNPLIAREFSQQHPELAGNLCLISPGIQLGDKSYDLRKAHGIDKNITLFLCPAGLRPVKGQVDLLDIFAAARSAVPDFHLAFCGPIIDQAYATAFRDALALHQWASYLGVIQPDEMANAMCEADVIVNNSVAEGLANSLLEAASLGMPILARSNLGNAAIVKQGVNGLLYRQQSEAVDSIRELLKPETRRRLSCTTSDYLQSAEAKDLERILVAAIKQY